MTSRIKYQNFAVDSNGDVVSGSDVEVRRFEGGALATLYAAETGATEAYAGVNPFSAGDGTPDKVGYFEFWVEPGLYTIAVGSGPSQVTYTVSLVEGEQRDFNGRASLVSLVADGATWPDGTVLSDGTVQYVASANATVIPDLLGLLPFGDIYPDHFAENTTPNTTDMRSAIEAALAYAAPRLRPVYLRAGITYRVNDTLRIDENSVSLIGAGGRDNLPTIMSHAADSANAIYAGPVDATNPATSAMTSFYVENIILRRQTPTSVTGAGFQLERITNVEFDNVRSWGHLIGVRALGVKNASYNDIGLSRLTNTQSGSLGIVINSLVLDDTSRVRGFTHKINSGIVSGNFEATVEVKDNDYTLINTAYLGNAQNAHVRLSPSHDGARLINTEIYGSYCDDVSIGSSATSLEITANGTTGTIELVKVDGGILAQNDRGIHIMDTAYVDRLEVSNVDFHNSAKEFIRSDSPNVGNIVLRGGNMWSWARDGSAAGTGDYAVYIDGADMVTIDGVDFKGNPAHSSNDDAIYLTNVTDAKVVNCHTASVATAITFTGSVTNRLIEGNTGSGDWPVANTYLQIPYTPEVRFGGAAVGVTYAAQADYAIKHPQAVFFTANVILTSKGTSTGNLAITLPRTAMAGNNNSVSVTIKNLAASTGRVGYVGVINGGSDLCEIRALTDAGTEVPLTDADVNNNLNLIVTGWYRA